MGLTTHGIKYPEFPDIPNVPDDIGGIAKLNLSAQAWLAGLDTANLGKIAAMDGRCATSEGNVTSANNSLTTATNRQNAQQTSVNAITARNDSVKSRLDARDASLTTEQTTVQGYAGQLASLNIQKGRGIVGVQTGITNQTIPAGSSWNSFASVTFNDPAPSANRVYRFSMQIPVYDASGRTSANWYTYIGFAYGDGTNPSTNPVYFATQLIDTNLQTKMPVSIEFIVTGITSSQWTLLGVADGNAAVNYGVGNSGVDSGYLLLEDIGLQL